MISDRFPNGQQYNAENNSVPEPIAIVGLGCRLPGGANSRSQYWSMLREGRSGISVTPRDRWSLSRFYSPGVAKPGKTNSQWGGYVDDIGWFDPQLFGISPREAAGMDPQQRLLLEVAWQALEDARHPIQSVAGRPISVFVGISSFDYALASLSNRDRGVINAYSNTGGSSSIAANRISYCFDLRGPSVAVDTACSSSLVAMHMACQSIWQGEAQAALAGGVNALILPDFYVAFSQLGVLSPDGSCKTFDSRANGYVRSEGAGMVLLKPLSSALADGDSIYCVVRATALNQDGHTDGMTVPSQEAQVSLMRSAYQSAGIDPAKVGYVEAHGTGTPVGDPIEANAIATVMGANRNASSPCWIGSVKTNIGHLEAGAGIASVIKVALAAKHREIPRHLNFQCCNPAIDLDGSGLRIPLEHESWDPIEGSWIAGINGFGYGGANAHVVIEALDKDAARTRLTMPNSNQASTVTGSASITDSFGSLGMPLPISGHSPAAARDVANQFAQWLDQHGDQYDGRSIVASAAHQRSHLRHRHVAFGTNITEWANSLRSYAETSADDPSTSSRPPSSQLSSHQSRAGILFACSGQGPQHWRMGRDLYASGGVFKQTIDQCDREFKKTIDWSLVDELHRDEASSRLQETSIAQPALFAIQVALAAQWNQLGVTPSALMGHSVGEIAASFLCGGLSFEDAALVAVHRGRTMDLASSRGAMIAAGISPDEALALIDSGNDSLSLAAVNGPRSVTLSGESPAIEQLAKMLEAQGSFVRRLAVEYAFHSAQMDPVEQELRRSLANIRPKKPHTAMFSTVTGQEIVEGELNASYWWQNVRKAVLFADALNHAIDAGMAVAVELGPHPVLSFSINECYSERQAPVQVITSIRRDSNEVDSLRDAFCQLFAVGGQIDWETIAAKSACLTADDQALPAYAMQRLNLWSVSPEVQHGLQNNACHPLLGTQEDRNSPAWFSRIDLKSQTYLTDHQVRGNCLYPAAAIIECSLAAAKQLFPESVLRLEKLQLHRPMVLTQERAADSIVEFRPDRSRLQFSFRDPDDRDWQALATVSVSKNREPISRPLDLDALYASCKEGVDRDRCYRYCQELGLQYGPAFQGLVRIWRRDGEAIGEVELPTCIVDEAIGHTIHPALLDACFHGMIVADANFDHTIDGLYLPHQIDRIAWSTDDRFLSLKNALVHVRITSKTHQRMRADLQILTPEGLLIGQIQGFESRRLASGEGDVGYQDLMYRYQWQASGNSDAANAGSAITDAESSNDANKADDGKANVGLSTEPKYWLLIAGRDEVATQLENRLRDRGDRVSILSPDESNLQASWWDEALLVHEADQVTDVVYLAGRNCPQTSDELPADAIESSSIWTTHLPLQLVQAWERFNSDRREHYVNSPVLVPRMRWITFNAQTRDEMIEPVDFCQSALIGFGRVVISESSCFESRLIDVCDVEQSDWIESLVRELDQNDDEDEVMIRQSNRYVRRFVPNETVPLPRPPRDRQQSMGPRRLSIGKTSGIEDLRYESMAEFELARGQVRIETLATGLNFSDVMKALDLYPGLPEGRVHLGAECSGRVIAVADDVTDFNVGDEVVAVARGSFATQVDVDQALVAIKPSTLSFDEAACIPIAFLTAQYALHECARVRNGESVLIHAASGGVGLAAIQLANLAGLKILATAGSDTKRKYLRDLGITEIMDSRSLAFADQTLCSTDGQGVDVILNSLPGEAIAKGLGILKPGGRFLEIGKRDIYGDAAVELSPFRNNLALFAIDLDQWFQTDAIRMGTMLREICERFESGELHALPTRSFGADQTRDAFRFMQQAKHIGKVAVSYQPGPQDIFPSSDRTESRSNSNGGASDQRKMVQLFRSDATYWIAGGLGGFGMQTAHWMLKRGARHLVLSGRNGPNKRSQEAIEQLEREGGEITILPCDVTQQVDVARALRIIRDQLPSLRGIFHTAMVLEDRLLVDLDAETLNRVLYPKLLGGWNLHAASMDRNLVTEPLDLFVLFSSLSSIFGHAGQANYSAANAALDGLAMYRRSQGLAGCVINWGHLGEVGYLAQRDELGRRLERQGVLAFSVKEATRCLEEVLRSGTVQASVLKMDWSVWRGLGLTKQVSPRFADLICETVDASEKSYGWDQISQASPEQRVSLIKQMISARLTTLLGLPLSQMDESRPLLELGLDSLMAVELRNYVESTLRINLPISELMRGATIAKVAGLVAHRVDQASQVAEQETLPSADSVDELADDEVDHLLAEMMQDPGLKMGVLGILDSGSQEINR